MPPESCVLFTPGSWLGKGLPPVAACIDRYGEAAAEAPLLLLPLLLLHPPLGHLPHALQSIRASSQGRLQ